MREQGPLQAVPGAVTRLVYACSLPQPQQEDVWWARPQLQGFNLHPLSILSLQAHIQAAEALLEGGSSSALAGKAYFVTNDDPRPFWGFMGDLCEGLGYGRPRIR